ncbi:hypothetical protein [Spirillospora sp. CA-128828]|uniref:hypothetical protein n=1 Tax=Spirillospora sp. CA-128828 TaxID=3240033 RepID=UPI003D8CE73F
MGKDEEKRRSSPAVVWASLGTAALFEALTVLATQDRAVRAVSPWQDDQYDVAVSLSQFTVPILALVIVLRLPAWRMPDGPDRRQQTERAAGAMTTLIGLTLIFEWSAVIGRAHDSAWSTWTMVLIGGLVMASILTVVVAAMLMRCRRPRGSSRRWHHDWLGDVIMICQRIPALRRWAEPKAAEWVRRRAMTVFITLSVLAAAGITGAQAIGERWTNPLLIAWMLVVETTSCLAFCLIGNAIAGFIARPAGTGPRRPAETSVVAGCVAILVTTAFRDVLWPGAGPLTSVPALVALTLGAGLITSLAVTGMQLARTPSPGPANGSK